MTAPRALTAVVMLAILPPGPQEPVAPFRADVDVVDLTATVTDRDGRFVSGLEKGDFVVYDDGVPQPLTEFSQEREPVSLGLLLDASGSMDREKLQAAQSALEQLVSTRLPPGDELFFVEFGYSASLTQQWTTGRSLIRGALRGVVRPTGDTALYDAVALAVPTAQSGRHRKKALLVVSDGRDSRSAVSLDELGDRLRRSDVMVYAIAIDTSERRAERVDLDALRRITDPTGGRTEVIRGAQHIDDAVARIADELGRQYRLAYARQGARDGRWHAIRVEVRKRGVHVRARSGYVAN